MPTLPPIRRSLQTVALAVLVLAAGCSSAQKEIRTASGGALPDAVAVVKESVAAIVERDPDAAAAKFTKMSSGLFAFYRGTSDLFYKYNEYYGIDESFVVRKDAQLQLHGDFHLENFGAYRSETGNVVFDLVDFDDTFRGPYLLDLRRMAVSLMIVCEEKGMAPEAEQVVMLFLRSYEQMMRSIAAGDRRADFCYRNGADVPAVDTIISAVKRIDRHEFLEKVCRTHISAGGSRRFNDDKGYAQVADLTSLKSAMDRYLDTVLPEYRKDDDYYAIKDAVISRRGGIGSAGKLRYLVLIEGMTADQYDDVVLEFKEQSPPGWAAYYGDAPMHNGRRVLMGFYLMQSEAYPGMGYTNVDGRDLFVSEFLPFYREYDADDIKTPEDLRQIAAVAGTLLAKGHIRGAEDQAPTAIVIADTVAGSPFKKDMMAFARGCARFMRAGYAAFRERLKDHPLLVVLVTR